MKAIQFTGTENNIENLHLALGISDNDMPQQSETRVYVIDVDNYEFDDSPKIWDDKKFINEAEIQGTVFTLEGFQKDFNYGDINSFTDVIRFINILI